MAIVDKSTQLKVGAKAAKTAAKHPRQSIAAGSPKRPSGALQSCVRLGR